MGKVAFEFLNIWIQNNTFYENNECDFDTHRFPEKKVNTPFFVLFFSCIFQREAIGWCKFFARVSSKFNLSGEQFFCLIQKAMSAERLAINYFGDQPSGKRPGKRNENSIEANFLDNFKSTILHVVLIFKQENFKKFAFSSQLYPRISPKVQCPWRDLETRMGTDRAYLKFKFVVGSSVLSTWQLCEDQKPCWKKRIV